MISSTHGPSTREIKIIRGPNAASSGKNLLFVSERGEFDQISNQ